MSNKQISKDNREYWENKLTDKFNSKKQLIKSQHQSEINKQVQSNYIVFKKRLGLDKYITELKKVENEYNDYKSNYEKRLMGLKEKLKLKWGVIEDSLTSWKETRNWNDDYDNRLPTYEKYEDNKFMDFTYRLENYLKDKCKEETETAFYNSKKGQELKQLDDKLEEATDLLHSDMIGSEVLRHISLIAKKSSINMTIPQNTVKELPNN
tara:strand:+ start:623 stop:1249 length:627 start_codon:yes stop_codon:yes gene_type:complete